MELPDHIREYFRKKGSTGGKKRARNMSANARSASARNAANARWSRVRKSAKKGSSGGSK